MSKVKAVLITDIHYDLNTLDIADIATNVAINKANELDVPLIIAGDMHNSKANMRGECINTIIKTINKCSNMPYILVGNHSRLNEKNSEHALNFLEKYAFIVSIPAYYPMLNLHLIPYSHDPDSIRRYTEPLKTGTSIIMHQGYKEAHAGEYIQDKSALNKQDLCRFNTLSGHYHRRQTIKFSHGSLTYLGNPYTLGYGEANDPEKGYHILYEDGKLEFIPLKLRRHIIFNVNAKDKLSLPKVNPIDLVWVKVQGSKEQLSKVSKDKIAKMLGILSFKFDTIETDKKVNLKQVMASKSTTQIFDSMIESLEDADDAKKDRLKTTYKGMMDD